MNIQTIPRDDKVVKRAFVPKLDAFLFFDFPNIEAKLLAYYLHTIGHPEMAKAFRDGLDMHLLTGAGIHNREYDELYARFRDGDEEADRVRQVGKKLNFSIIYGGGIPTIMRQLGISADEALEILSAYHRTWPGIGWASRYRDANQGTLVSLISERLATTGYVKTLWGRHLRPHSPHVATNALVQGCAADLMKSALRHVHKGLQGYESHLVNVVHDELMIDARLSEIPELVSLVPGWMTPENIDSVVPIRPTADIATTTWADKKPYKEEER